MTKSAIIRVIALTVVLSTSAYVFFIWFRHRQHAHAQPPLATNSFAQANPREFRPRQVVQPYPPITRFEILAADQVGDRVNPADLVIGVVHNGKARAYPINILVGPSREILNDTMAGVPIAATW